MLNNTKNASSIKTISFFLLFFCIAIFYIKFIINQRKITIYFYFNYQHTYNKQENEMKKKEHFRRQLIRHAKSPDFVDFLLIKNLLISGAEFGDFLLILLILIFFLFSHMKYLWNNNRSRMRHDLVGAELKIRMNTHLTCKEFYKCLLTKPDLLKKIRSSDKYSHVAKIPRIV